MLKELEDAVSEVQRVDAKAQSALDLKKQNLKDETKKRGELVKSMEEVHGTRLLGCFGLLLSQDGCIGSKIPSPPSCRAGVGLKVFW